MHMYLLDLSGRRRKERVAKCFDVCMILWFSTSRSTEAMLRGTWNEYITLKSIA